MKVPLTPEVQAKILTCGKEVHSMRKARLTTSGSASIGSNPKSPGSHRYTHQTPLVNENVKSYEPDVPPLVVARRRAFKEPRVLRRSKSMHDIQSERRGSKVPTAGWYSNDSTCETAHGVGSVADTAVAAPLRRSKSTNAISSLINAGQEMLIDESDIDKAAKAMTPSRIRLMRHIVGFRKYNQLPEVRRKIIAVCDIVKSMTQRHHSAFQLTLDEVDSSLETLKRVEEGFYREADRLNDFDARAQELQYLKAKAELCIRTSVAKVKEEYQKRILPMHGIGRRNLLDNGTDAKWRGHNEIRISVNELKTNLRASQGADERSGSVPSIFTVHQEIIAALNRCARKNDWHNLRPLFDAEDELNALQDHLNKIQRMESQLRTSLLRYQAATNTLLSVNREISVTTRFLQGKTIITAAINEQRMRNLDDEEQLFRQFVKDGHQHGQLQGMVSPPATPMDRLPPLSDAISPLTPGSSPVYLSKWSSSTKLLGHQHHPRAEAVSKEEGFRCDSLDFFE